MRIFVLVSIHECIISYNSFLYDTVWFCILSYYTTIILLVYGIKVFYIVSCYVILHDYITCARCWDFSSGSDYGPCKLLDFELERTGKGNDFGNQVVT